MNAQGSGHQHRLVCGCNIIAGGYDPLEIRWCPTHLAAHQLLALAKKIAASPFAQTRDEAPEALDHEMIEIVDDARAALAMKEGK